VGNPIELIVWTFPRFIQPAMSAWIVDLGNIVFSVVDRRQPATFLEKGTI
jgi:hypothetical protein